MSRGIGIFGGTFDPIHYGHLRVADEVRAALDLAEVRLMPAGNPYHRSNVVATAAQRLAMAQLAVREFPGLTVDAREAVQATPSYTVDALSSLRAEMPGRPLLLLIGVDAFLSLPRWKRWTDLFALAHMVIVARPGAHLPAPVPPPLDAVWAARLTDDPRLLAAPAGRIYLQAVTPQPVSATQVRALMRAGRRPDGLLPPAVVAYIESHSLYKHS